MVLTVDYLRNVGTHYLLDIDANHTGDAAYLNTSAAQNAIAATNSSFGCGLSFASAATDCAIGAGATISDYSGFGLDSAAALQPALRTLAPSAELIPRSAKLRSWSRWVGPFTTRWM
jgi:hypothetical protein